ncbi:hypothetical protein [Pseudoalteromonas sp. APC 3355]|uniref:hypothetical protein n=1 Tax=Pseudoalteromonas sp. APC 3355 TaxID=3035199 RepID=UPI0025B357B9|nr:hypothetical protein [Pseudoalteromonas sp. APC 3355]MDN3474296.1 hypothetical protein [Pseudoalteromonas sp. APC 3355]
MREEIREELREYFSGEQEANALEELNSITLQHVMAESQMNLDNTWSAIIKLSKGDLQELTRLTECAKKDFRDVVYWASLE